MMKEKIQNIQEQMIISGGRMPEQQSILNLSTSIGQMPKNLIGQSVQALPTNALSLN